MSTNSELKRLHDALLDQLPDDVEHDRDTCPLCVLEAIDNATELGGLMPETFTEDDVRAAVEAATEPLQKRLDELAAQAKETEVGKAVAEARAELDTKIAELQDQLDAAVAGQTAAETKLAETEQFWAEAIEAASAADALAKTKDERTAAAKETGALPDEYIEKNADRFAAYSEDEWVARLDEWKVVAAAAGKKPAAAVGAPPAKTALEAGAAETTTSTSNLAFLSEMRKSHVDPRTLGGVG